jgi:hypothetical protein
MPQIFGEFRSQLFLIGINLNFLLNLTQSQTAFLRLLQALLADPTRRVQLLIADLWQPDIRSAYEKTLYGYGVEELRGLDEVFGDRPSKYKLDTFIRNHCDSEQYARLRGQLAIRKMGLLMDTLWFVDAGEHTATGSMLLSPITAPIGSERPVYYFTQLDHAELFAAYYNLCQGGFGLATPVWPHNA